ncbi:MAG: hydrogenase nickel incorporation protein HypB [Bacteroidota bacterium]|nr:hydrogenase nickel incorporation protein HypB [Bacteroidota bacterium]
MEIITVEQKILKKNEDVAAELKKRFDDAGVFVVNLVSSPGSGKTTLLEQTLKIISPALSIGVIEGDIQTSLDAERISQYNIPVAQIITNGTCHLEARMIEQAIEKINLDDLDILFIENVGNLVCPASYNLGEHARVVVMSTTEGEDKPLKYPAMFSKSCIMVLNKIDLLPYLKFNIELAKYYALKVNPGLKIFETSCYNNHGILEWCEWLTNELKLKRCKNNLPN